jgi:hypothetical protein
MDFRTAVRAYNQICRIKINDSHAVHLLLHGLNLGHYPMFELHLMLAQVEAKGTTLAALMSTLANIPNISALVQMENQLNTPIVTSTRSFFAGQENDADESSPAGLPSVDGTAYQRYATYNADAILQSFKVGKAANRFPRNLGAEDPSGNPDIVKSRSGARQEFYARDKTIRAKLQAKIGSKCNRCFRLSCLGHSDGKYLCEVPGTAGFIPKAWTHVLKSILMWLTMEKANYDKTIEAFYTNQGQNFGSLDAYIRPGVASGVDKAGSGSSYFTSSSFNNVKSTPTSHANGINRKASRSCRRETVKTLQVKPTEKAREQDKNPSNSNLPAEDFHRCLASLPDLGNPSILAGLCWWKDSAPLLEEAGLLQHVRKCRSMERMSFGDAPRTPPLFVLLQVPLWYQCKNGNSILVFTNIRVVSNLVGLLDGKKNLAAMVLSCVLDNDGSTQFRCQGKTLDHIDEDSYFFLRLNKPRPFSAYEVGMAVYRNTTDS